MFYVTSPHEYAVASFIDGYRLMMPQLVMVKQGYHGDTCLGTLDFSSGQVLRIHGVHTERRVFAKVVKDASSHFGVGDVRIGIPESCSIPVCLINKNGTLKKATELQIILREQKLPIMIELTCSMTRGHLKIRGKTVDLKSGVRLHLQREYEEKYIYGNPVNEGVLHRNIISIPASMTGLTLLVVTGLHSGDDEYWKSILESMTHTADNYIKFDNKICNTDMIVCLSSSSDKAVESPIKETVKSTTTFKTDKKKESAYEDCSPSVQSEHHYEEIPANSVDIKDYNSSSESTQCGNCDIPTVKSTSQTENAKLFEKSETFSYPRRQNENKNESFQKSEYYNIVKSQYDVHKQETGTVNKCGGILKDSVLSAGQSVKDTDLQRENCQRKISIVKPVLSDTDVEKLTVNDIGQYLNILNLGHHAKQLSDALIDGELLKDLDEEILVDEFGFKRFEAIKLMKFARHGYLPKGSHETCL